MNQQAQFLRRRVAELEFLVSVCGRAIDALRKEMTPEQLKKVEESLAQVARAGSGNPPSAAGVADAPSGLLIVGH